MKNYNIILFIFILWIIYPIYSNNKCYHEEISNFITINSKKWIQKKDNVHLYTINIENVNVDVYIPEIQKQNCIKTLLVLPGWKFSRKRWFEETQLLKFIYDYSYIAIAPEMNISIYESEYFPETKWKWNKKPGLKFIEDDLIPYFRNFNILIDNKYNFGLGLSTGARGIVLIASRNINLFYGIAALSGDYDQTLTPQDKLIQSIYGEYNKYKERWQTIDNPIYNIKKNGWNTSIYLGHGLKDIIVNSQHTIHFYNFLNNHYKNVNIKLHLCNDCKHDFYYWNKELKEIFLFFDEIFKKN